MASFTDCTGRNWQVRIGDAERDRVQGELGIDLAEVTTDGPALVNRLLGDAATLTGVLYLLCRDQANERGVTAEAFRRAISTTRSIREAATALLDALVDLLPTELRATVRSSYRPELHGFTDRDGQLWTLDVGNPQQFAERCGDVDLDAFQDVVVEAALTGDSATVAKAVWPFVKHQAAARGIDRDSLAELVREPRHLVEAGEAVRALLFDLSATAPNSSDA